MIYEYFNYERQLLQDSPDLFWSHLNAYRSEWGMAWSAMLALVIILVMVVRNAKKREPK